MWYGELDFLTWPLTSAQNSVGLTCENGCDGTIRERLLGCAWWIVAVDETSALAEEAFR
jgi:hypothetical protein